MKLRWSGHLVRMDDERLVKRLFYGDIATGSRRQGEPPPPSPSSFSSTAAPMTAIVASAIPTNTTHDPDTSSNTNTTTNDTRVEDLVYTCPHCGCTFTSHIGLVGHLRIYRTETGEPVPGAQTYTRRIRLNCPHCRRTFTHRMGLFGRMRILEKGFGRSPDIFITSKAPDIPSPDVTPPPCASTANSSITLSTSCTPDMLIPTHTSPPIEYTTAMYNINITKADTDTADFSCPHSSRTFTSRIVLENEVDGLAHFPHYKRSDAFEAITVHYRPWLGKLPTDGIT
nr:unnamed protein product [Spirometra erinaceieuropaei]